MSTDCGDKNDRVLRVRKRPASSEVVSRRAGWGSNADSICKQGGEMLIVAEEFNLRHG
jgi:hypothetical protein